MGKRTKYLTLASALLLIAIVVSTGLGYLRFLIPYVKIIPFGDKICHFAIIGMLSFLLSVNILFGNYKRKLFALILCNSILALLAAASEISQIWVRHRFFDYTDLYFDYIGIISFTAAAIILKRKKDPGIRKSV